MSREETPVLAGSMPAFEMFMTAWENLAETHPRLAPFIEIGLTWARKYYQRMDNTKAYVMAMGKFCYYFIHITTNDLQFLILQCV